MTSLLNNRRLALLVTAVLLAVATAVVVPRVVRTDVRLAVDGAVTDLRTAASTVGELIETQGVELAAGDRVLPSRSRVLAEGTVVRVLRSINVRLDVDGEVTRLRGTFRTVSGALDEAGIEVADDQLVEPDPRTRLHSGDRVVIRSPRTVTVAVDGDRSTFETHLDSVAGLLEARGVTLGPDDRVWPALDRPVEDGTHVLVERVTFEQQVREDTRAFTTETRSTDELLVGESRVAQEGRDGLVRTTLRLTYVDGELEATEEVGSEVVRAMQPRIVEEGTEQEPADDGGYTDDGSVWYDLAECESNQRWHIDSRYDGGLQFLPATWTAYKPAGAPTYAWQASPEVQIEAAKRLQAAAGWGQWPSCARQLGLL